MTEPDPFLDAVRPMIDRALDDLRRCVDAADAEALNWRPGGDDTNSIAVLAVHSLHSTRSWLAVAMGAPLPERDREAEFLASVAGAGELLALAGPVGDDCRALLSRPAPDTWQVPRRTHPRPAADAPRDVTAAWALVHAVEHLREHTGQMLLTRQLCDLRTNAP